MVSRIYQVARTLTTFLFCSQYYNWQRLASVFTLCKRRIGLAAAFWADQTDRNRTATDLATDRSRVCVDNLGPWLSSPHVRWLEWDIRGSMAQQSDDLVTIFNSLLSQLFLAEFKQSVIDKAIDQWRPRLRACVRASGQHFEQLIKWNNCLSVERFCFYKDTFIVRTSNSKANIYIIPFNLSETATLSFCKVVWRQGSGGAL